MRSAKEILHPDNDWQTAYAELAVLVKYWLCTNTNKAWTTTELAAFLWPMEQHIEDHRWRLFKGLKAIALHDCADHVRPGPVKRIFGKKKSTLLWQTPGYDL